FVEKLVTLAKKDSLHARRLCAARLHDEVAVKKLFDEFGPRFKDRPGGYTRVIKRHERRLGDGGHTAFLEVLKAGEKKVQAKARAAAPAPRVTEPPPAAPPASKAEPTSTASSAPETQTPPNPPAI